MAELTAPFVFKNDDKRIVYGPVLIPDEPDTDDDVVTADHIETVAHKFVEDYGNIDLMHSLNNVGRLVESYVLPMDLKIDKNNVVPKGSWMLGVRVTDDATWKSVKEKKLGGFSIMAMQKAAMKSAKKADDKEESKRVTLADLGDDWIVNAVSLVDEPAVPKAKWIAIKSKDDENSNININDDTVKKAVAGSLEHRRRLIDDALEKSFGGHERYPFIHSTLEETVIFRIRDHQDNLKHYQVGYNIKENGEVDFTETPQEVRIEENVVPIQVENMLGSTASEKSNTSEDNSERSAGFMSKFMQSIGLGNKNAEKAGKIISAGNLKKLQQAKEVIDDLLAIGEKERENKSKKGADADMDKNEVEKLIGDHMEPLNSKLDDVLKAMQADAKGDNEGDQQGENQSSKSKNEENEQDQQEGNQASKGKGEGDSGGEKDEYKDKYEAVLKELDKVKNKPFSRRISGQDNTVEKNKDEYKPDRNAFGFKGK